MLFSKKTVLTHYERNLRHDLTGAMDPDGLLNGQDREALRDMSFGFSRVGRAGCESIAVYNALLRLGLPRPLPEIIRDMEKGGYMRLGGHWGAVPYFQPLLRRYGARTRAVTAHTLSSQAQRGELGQGSVFLMCIFNDRLRVYRGLHSFCGVYDPLSAPERPWVIYNRFNSDPAARRYAELRDVLKNGPYRGAYLVIYRVERL